MVAIIPPITVDRPSAQFPLRYGLLAAAIGPLDFPDRHARGGGLQYVETLCSGGQGYEINCIDALDVKSFNLSGLNVVLGVPFVVMSNYTCALSTTDSVEQAEEWAREKFFSVEQAVVESVFSSGDFAAAPALATNPDLVDLNAIDPGTTTNPVDTVSILERWIYCDMQYGPPAYIHAPIPVFNRLKQEHLIEFDGLRWRTPMGSVVVGGCIFSESPDASGTFQVYVTGQVAVWRTANGDLEQPTVQGALNRTTNQYTGLVEREYVVTFDCGVATRNVTLWPAP